jgi:hypothetical protein
MPVTDSTLPAEPNASREPTPLVDWLDAAREAVRQGKRGSDFSPIPIEGEPLSATILRDRGPY